MRRKIMNTLPKALYRIKPGSWFAKRYSRVKGAMKKRLIDENGNGMYRYLSGGNETIAGKEYRRGNLVDVTDDPTQEIKWEGVRLPQKADMAVQKDRVIRKPAKKRGGKKS